MREGRVGMGTQAQAAKLAAMCQVSKVTRHTGVQIQHKNDMKQWRRWGGTVGSVCPYIRPQPLIENYGATAREAYHHLIRNCRSQHTDGSAQQLRDEHDTWGYFQQQTCEKLELWC